MSLLKPPHTEQRGMGRIGTPGDNTVRPKASNGPAGQPTASKGVPKQASAPDPSNPADVRRKNDAGSGKAINNIAAQHSRPGKSATATEAVNRQVSFLRASALKLIQLTLLPAS
jgi:hypothetical protein